VFAFFILAFGGCYFLPMSLQQLGCVINPCEFHRKKILCRVFVHLVG